MDGLWGFWLRFSSVTMPVQNLILVLGSLRSTAPASPVSSLITCRKALFSKKTIFTKRTQSCSMFTVGLEKTRSHFKAEKANF
jgi:hypothetical protein